jgi:Cys-tRNA(Pro) deacylase
MRGSIEVHNFLKKLNIPHEICTVDLQVKAAEMVAAQLGLSSREIGKTLVMLADGEPIIVVIPGCYRVNFKKLKSVVKAAKIRLAEPEEVAKYTGYILGAVPPFAHATEIPVFIDRTMLEQEILYVCGGAVNCVLKIRSDDLVNASEAIVTDIIEDGEKKEI